MAWGSMSTSVTGSLILIDVVTHHDSSRMNSEAFCPPTEKYIQFNWMKHDHAVRQ